MFKQCILSITYWISKILSVLQNKAILLILIVLYAILPLYPDALVLQLVALNHTLLFILNGCSLILFSFIGFPLILFRNIKRLPLSFVAFLSLFGIILGLSSFLLLVQFAIKLHLEGEQFIYFFGALINIIFTFNFAAIIIKCLYEITDLSRKRKKPASTIIVSILLTIFFLCVPDAVYALSYQFWFQQTTPYAEAGKLGNETIDVIEENEQFLDTRNHILAFRKTVDNYFEMYYFSFSIHYALSLNNETYQFMQTIIQNNTPLKLQQIVHIVFNRLMELILISYIVSIIIDKVKEGDDQYNNNAPN